jgi:hypothetical protein
VVCDAASVQIAGVDEAEYGICSLHSLRGGLKSGLGKGVYVNGQVVNLGMLREAVHSDAGRQHVGLSLWREITAACFMMDSFHKMDTKSYLAAKSKNTRTNLQVIIKASCVFL